MYPAVCYAFTKAQILEHCLYLTSSLSYICIYFMYPVFKSVQFSGCRDSSSHKLQDWRSGTDLKGHPDELLIA